MSARDQNAAVGPSAKDVEERMHVIDWKRVLQDLDARGSALIERLLTPAECEALAARYPVDDIYRSRVVMERHGFGRGEYKYFSYPLPDIVARL
ncbi:MAG: proline hydroxylase, partial [Burkholderiales bacterium]